MSSRILLPAIVDEETFNAVQALLQSRNPKRVAPRVVNGPTLLAGVARCGHCGAALIQNTGKGGLYRYYCCSRKLKEGATACKGLRMPMERLDQIVIDEVSARVLRPDRITCLLTLVEQGVMKAEDASLRERLAGLKVRRDELAAEVSDLQKRITSGEPTITPDKVGAFAALLRDKLRNGSPDLKQAYVRFVMREVSVRDKEIRISGSKAVLARAASAGLDMTAPGVLSFVRQWRTRQDSNLWPAPSEGRALSGLAAHV